MSIIQPTQPTLIEQAYNGIANNNQELLQCVENTLQLNTHLVWGSTAYTPQQMFDMFGTSAGQLIQMSNALTQLVQSVDSTFVPFVPPVTPVVNTDGTVTVPLT